VLKKPVDLSEMYGRRYVVTLDLKSASGPRDCDPWLAQIETRVGVVYPFSATHLGVQVDGHPIIAGRIGGMGYPLIQDGDAEKTFLVPAEELDRIARLIRPKRRRRFRDAAERASRLAVARQKRGQQV
jgi:predicted DNA-binding WGR domain protein